jgi:ABC-2 type transport system permease protein
MLKIIKIAQREFIETVKTKTFIISLLITPVIIGAIVLINNKVTSSISGPRPPKNIIVTDLTGQLSNGIKESFDQYNKYNTDRQILLKELRADQSQDTSIIDNIRSDRLDAYFVLDKDCIDGQGKIRSYIRTSKLSDASFMSIVENQLNRAIVNRRCELRNISPELIADIRRNVLVEQIDVSTATPEKQDKIGRQLIKTMMPFFFMMMMFMGIFGYGQQMLTGIIEEKSSRIIEVLLSAVSPFQLMSGKILGIAGIGITVIALWIVAAYATARWQGLNIAISAELIICFVVYYVLGFLLFSSIFAAIGSVCNTLKEAQGLMMPISFVLIIPMMAWPIFTENPDGAVTRAASFFPLLTPMVMMLRISGGSGISPIEILATILVLAASVWVVMWLAARIFRIGILMYGKRPGLKEVSRWLTQT